MKNTESIANHLTACVRRLTLTLLGVCLLAVNAAAQDQSSPQVVAAPNVEFMVKQGKTETRIKMYFERGIVTKVTATDADGMRNLTKTATPGIREAAITQVAVPCQKKNQSCKTIKLKGGGTVKVCFCNLALRGLLVPAVQMVRETAGKSGSGGGGTGGGGNEGGGGTGCTTAHPCCHEDEKLQMSICTP